MSLALPIHSKLSDCSYLCFRRCAKYHTEQRFNLMRIKADLAMKKQGMDMSKYIKQETEEEKIIRLVWMKAEIYENKGNFIEYYKAILTLCCLGIEKAFLVESQIVKDLWCLIKRNNSIELLEFLELYAFTEELPFLSTVLASIYENYDLSYELYLPFDKNKIYRLYKFAAEKGCIYGRLWIANKYLNPGIWKNIFNMKENVRYSMAKIEYEEIIISLVGEYKITALENLASIYESQGYYKECVETLTFLLLYKSSYDGEFNPKILMNRIKKLEKNYKEIICL